MNAFEKCVRNDCRLSQSATEIRVLQANVGFKCNQRH